MYTNIEYMYIKWYSVTRYKGCPMATARNRTHKHFQLDSVKIKRAQKALRAKTETETIERALDLAISEHESNRLTLEANERFLRRGGRTQRRVRKIGSLDASCLVRFLDLQ